MIRGDRFGADRVDVSQEQRMILTPQGRTKMVTRPGKYMSASQVSAVALNQRLHNAPQGPANYNPNKVRTNPTVWYGDLGIHGPAIETLEKAKETLETV
eukprot:CAMPEP_0184305184 /NCGR_PEP_ID=MMETSP1049-20130417/14519_1 /TAXON_ID=77928 /ORGANISM="Proteomonas sulcata, Strain CCMP704" /LENGTH=98 /DNA_ID=CAMNT_0026617187 /DNA_START=23 /DNA_END=319 /DNA_ORIENTATION=+